MHRMLYQSIADFQLSLASAMPPIHAMNRKPRGEAGASISEFSTITRGTGFNLVSLCFHNTSLPGLLGCSISGAIVIGKGEACQRYQRTFLQSRSRRSPTQVRG